MPVISTLQKEDQGHISYTVNLRLPWVALDHVSKSKQTSNKNGAAQNHAQHIFLRVFLHFFFF